MAKKLLPETLCQRTRKDLELKLSAKKLEGKIYEDYVDLYVEFYDDLLTINKQIFDMKQSGKMSIRSYTDATGEKRRIAKEMRDILTFLGLQPDKKEGDVYTDEEL